jgi:predicted kinase
MHCDGRPARRNPQLVITRGLPGSGKTTYARIWVAAAPHERARVNRDDLRRMLYDRLADTTTEAMEDAVSVAQQGAIEALLREGHEVIADDTNISQARVSAWEAFAKKQRVPLSVVETFGVPLKTCIERDAARPNPVGELAILRMWDAYQAER